MKLNETFLFKCWQQSRSVFWFFILFIFGQAYFTYKGVETYPFLNWGMYSGPMSAKPQYPVQYLMVNGAVLIPRGLENKELSNRQADNLMDILTGYELFTSRNGVDPMKPVVESRFKGRVPESLYQHIYASICNHPAAAEAFIEWVPDYINRLTGIEVNHIVYANALISYSGNKRPELVRVDTIFSIHPQ